MLDEHHKHELMHAVHPHEFGRLSIIEPQYLQQKLEDAVNYIWLFVVSGGAALLGFALAFGMISQDPKRSIGAIAGSFIVAILALGAGIYVSQASTAPIQPPDRNHTEKSLPAGPAHTEELPGEPKSR